MRIHEDLLGIPHPFMHLCSQYTFIPHGKDAEINRIRSITAPSIIQHAFSKYPGSAWLWGADMDPTQPFSEQPSIFPLRESGTRQSLNLTQASLKICSALSARALGLRPRVRPPRGGPTCRLVGLQVGSDLRRPCTISPPAPEDVRATSAGI